MNPVVIISATYPRIWLGLLVSFHQYLMLTMRLVYLL